MRISRQIRPPTDKLRHMSIFIAPESTIAAGETLYTFIVTGIQQRSFPLSFRKRLLSGILWRKLKS
ncbi:hypothetical protein ACJJIX_09430 [Microbulbifer sp. VAAC004]|uniref:hypothetical protein n=1 Tax=Microbulbifer sp. VAAC004 TaxID=3243385 RepID=UPI004039044E